jgi:hypothetical protein
VALDPEPMPARKSPPEASWWLWRAPAKRVVGTPSGMRAGSSRRLPASRPEKFCDRLCPRPGRIAGRPGLGPCPVAYPSGYLSPLGVSPSPRSHTPPGTSLVMGLSLKYIPHGVPIFRKAPRRPQEAREKSPMPSYWRPRDRRSWCDLSGRCLLSLFSVVVVKITGDQRPRTAIFWLILAVHWPNPPARRDRRFLTSPGSPPPGPRRRCEPLPCPTPCPAPDRRSWRDLSDSQFLPTLASL